MDSIVSKQWLLARMYEPDLIIVDCRFQLGSPKAGQDAFKASHIPGAIYLDLEEDLSAPIGEHGGRHPLPDPQTLAQRLGQVGISNSSHIIAYDDQGGMYASRLWWLLRWLGHDNVYVMDEGFTSWKEAGYLVTDAIAVQIPSTFQYRIRKDMVVDMQTVGLNLDNPSILFVDSREPARYQGLQEPIDAKAGHIPGAINSLWKNVLKDQVSGSWKNEEELREHFAPITQALDHSKEVIVYCGSGVSACPNVLALYRLGYEQVKLYSGSWSDWISYEENPVATGKEGKA
ncbi:thiosulfate/3-mercaptopyruvate sulfurtransferase [Fontibacillus panacisegetis]|uniref:Thiosulfate/3-mercaptopyruvate sulfurtransferase n=1 Tax=Fontibacillus panacisegetis TaxID=670482 RepID=A0A1G7LR04_9BACL|nr:sulfurtransferase [Fontibacillus panacisegetis]SDF51409.1 thiosulfate/3-mercaptopyruvate sulfurtransferase [Fontibacillus panacisegetis]